MGLLISFGILENYINNEHSISNNKEERKWPKAASIK
jgi:hypothetical protein